MVVNLGVANSTGRIYFGDDLLTGSGLRFDDLLNDRSYEPQIADLKRWGLYIKLVGFGAHIFDVKRLNAP